jgi:hypothetical protein
MRRVALVAISTLCALVAGMTHAAEEASPEDPRAIVFLRSLGRGEGAPSKEGAGKLVVLSEVGEKDRRHEIVKLLRARGATAVVPFSADRLDPAFERLRRLAPEFVAVVLRPETLDVHFHFDFLERASRLDDDPFVDFAFGYLTGATPEEAVEFAKGTAPSPAGTHPRSIVEFGPSAPHPLTPEAPHSWAKGFTTRRLAHAEGAKDVPSSLRDARGAGVLSAWGHGMPDGDSGGMTGAQVRESGLDLSGTLYFSGPCFCGVTDAWWEPSGYVAKERHVAPKESFALALIGARATAVFAGLDPDRGETNHHELEHLLLTGEPLGAASKATYDQAVVAYRRPQLVLPRHSTSRPAFRDIHDQMISGGACRALFGDPTYRPFEKAGTDATVETSAGKEGLTVTWTATGAVGWTPVDVYRAHGGWTHRIVFRIELPRDAVASAKELRVLSVTKDEKPLPYDYPTLALESWCGKTRLHGMLILPTKDPRERPLWGGKRYEARLLLTR